MTPPYRIVFRHITTRKKGFHDKISISAPTGEAGAVCAAAGADLDGGAGLWVAVPSRRRHIGPRHRHLRYVGTVVRSDGKVLDNILAEDERDIRDFGWDSPQMGGQAFLEELPEGLVQWLYDSESVSRIDSRRTQAALLGDYFRTHTEETGPISKIDDTMMSVSEGFYYYLEATVESVMNNEWRDDDEITVDNYRVHVDRMWSDPNFSQDTMTLKVWCMSAEPQFEVGQRLFLIGDYVYYGENGVPSDQNTVIDSLPPR